MGVYECQFDSVHFNCIYKAVFIEDVKAAKNSRMNPKVYGVILAAQIQLNAAKLIAQCFTVQIDNDPKHSDKTHKQDLTEGGCTKGLAVPFKGGNTAFGDIYGF